MAIVEVDGFQFLDSDGIVIEQDRIEEYLEHIKTKEINNRLRGTKDEYLEYFTD